MSRSAMAIVFMILAGSFFALGQVQVGISATDQGVQSFYLSIGEHYNVPPREVTVIRDRHIPDDEIPVVFFIARRAHVRPAVIVDMRLHGDSWMVISRHYGIGADAYYIPVEGVSGPPYGKAYGYFKNRPRKEWKRIELGDDDIVNFVNLRFAKEHYGSDPTEVMRMRSEGKSFLAIHNEISPKYHGRGDKDERRAASTERGKGREKHHDRTKGDDRDH